MTDNLSELFKQYSIEMIRRGQTRLISPGIAASTTEHDVSRLLQHSAIAPVDCLLAASAAGLLPSHQPPAHFPDSISCNRYLLQHLERRGYCIRTAQADDLPALLLLEERCWAEQLRTPEAVLKQRIARYPQGQLVLTVDDAVVGVIYSQRIDNEETLDGVAVAQVDSLHNPEAKVVQLLAVNILPDMQQQNLGDQLLEFMLIYRSLQKDVQAVVAITLCKNFDRTAGLALEDYIRRRNEHGVLSDPILRFHELHGAAIQRVMPGYRPSDLKNEGCGVLVGYDIHHRSRNDMRIDAAKTTRFTRSEIRGYLQNALSDCLGEQRKSAFSFDRPLMEMGLDSADLLELNEKIAFRYQLPLTPAFFFQYNTADKIAGYLCEHVVPEQNQDNKREAQQTKCVVTKPQGQASTQDVAIVGMACRLPGGIDTPEEFWQCLQTGASAVGELPAGRWQWPDEIDPVHKHQGIDRGGFLDNVAAFDAPFFRISPAEAESMDPQQRILLELGWQAIEHAGYAPDSLAGSNTGVFIGASGSDYARLLDQSRSPVDAHYGTGNSMAVLANRISYFYDFHGPSLLLDTACSSSLVAVHKAVQSIQTGESSQALVGGINLICHPANSIAYYKAGMLAKDGRCKTFDQQANGYVRSEGAVMLLLKPLVSALSDHDRIYAVIKGTACNHGGQAGGLTVPNPEQQARLLQTAWQAAKINPRSLGYIEAHGTGTSLGDPIEVQGLKQAFAQAGMQPEKSCGLGSVKTNLGHLEAAAGITGLLKTVLCLQHRQLPASLHFHQLNEHIELSDSCLYVVDRLQPWTPPTDGGPRIAAVSSFGSGGANAHAVLAEYPLDVDAAVEADRPLVFVLSAKTRPQLQVYAQKYVDWLSDDSSRSVSMTDLVYTLQIGRQAMEERLALVITDRQDLIGKLAAFCSNQQGDEQVYQFSSKAVPAQFRELTEGDAGRAFIRSLVAQRDWDRIALLWLSGVEVDWSLLDGDQAVGGRQPRRIAVPTYPFAKHAYWLPNAELPQERNTAGKARVEAAVEDVLPTVLAPLWRPVIDSKNTGLFPNHDDGVLIIGGSSQQQQAIRSVYTAAQSTAIDPAVTIESLSRQLRELGNLDHIIWIAPKPDAASEFSETLVEQQNSGLLYVFKLVKALLAESYGNRDLSWTVITCQTQAVFNEDAPDPAHAGVHGLVGALAKEYPRWSIRALDMENHLDWPVRELMSLPADRQGDVLAFRGGQWFKRFLSPVEKLPESTPVYRQRGVYVVAGGAGGIGEAWTRYAIQHYQAQVIWIGRRRPDAAIQAKLDALAGFGPAPVYVVADASNPESLRAAYVTIKQRWPVIHGVIHSAVGLFDHSLVEMDEQRFRDILSAKIDISVNLAQVFKYEPLDFMLYFSSVVALEKNGGLSGYAAGGAFEDAFALHLAKQRTCAVKVINWGHWEIGTGDAISAATKIRLQLSGIIPIQPDEAMTVLQGLLTAPVNQLALLKTSRLDVLPMIDPDQNLSIYADTVPRCIDRIPPVSEELNKRVETLRPLSIFNNAELEAQLLPLFAGTLQSLGLLDESGESPHGFYSQWLEASRKILAEQRLSRGALGNPEQLWQAWEKAKQDSFGNAGLTAAIELAEACLRALPDILSGRRRATDILFPDSSMRRVEGIYRNNAVADYFNRILGESLVAAIGTRLQKDPDAQLRILEIGAGAGGTTATILPLLAPYRQHIAEYAYTDVSKAFLFHAEEQFVKDYPYVRPKLFDVEKPLAGQDIAAQHYDLVIATNVLHATRNIRQTLSNAKAALHKNGLLLVNEISGKSLFAHLTFGLLEGWWLSEDQPLRIPDAPGLYPETWKQVLGQEGFDSVLFPAPDTHVLGQQVIVAESDGVVRQQKTLQKSPVNPAPCVLPSTADELPKPAAISSDEGLKEASNFHLKKLAAKTLRMNSHDIDALEPLETYGIDSILVVQITNALREIFPDVRSTLLFECQTIDALSDYFINNNKDELIRLTGLQAQSAAPEPLRPASQAQARAEKTAGRDDTAQLYRSDNKPDAGQDAIAVIGMSCHFPQADNVDDYWQILKSGQDCIREVPADRWPMQDFFDADPDRAVEQGKSYSKWGGFLDNVTDFDPLFFNISPKEAIAIDPQERLFLQTAWETLEDAGYTRERLVNDFKQQVGVFAGITRTGFDLFGPQLWRQGLTVYPHTSFSSAANRVSYFLNARGPSVPVDTMCSSSLTAIHQACQSLRSGECRLAIAGGVNIYLHPSGYVGLSASRMLSKDGVCRSFGKGGNGFVPGEGAGAVLLKPLSQAIADNDRIYATIRASHVNHGGKTNGYTVPNPQAQAELVRDTLQKAGVDARAVSYIEAHGTGTELGDPIEVSGLTQAFQHTTQDTGFCALGSAKSNVGHLEAAAGIAGFIKVILQLRHGQLAPSLHAAELNPNIDFAKTPFVVQQTLADWQRPLLEQQGELKEFPRIAGISAFGAGGANAHVLVEEYRQPERLRPDAAGQGCVVVLSAKNEERLKAYAGRLHDFIGRRIADGDELELPDLAYTLQVGREQMDERLALVAHSLAQLQEKLKAYISGQDEVEDLYQGQVKRHKELIAAFAGDESMQQTVDAWFRQRKYSRLLNLWTKGMDIDWERLYQGQCVPRRISLPTYPFAATRYWLPLVETKQTQQKTVDVASALAPLPIPQAAAAALEPMKRTLSEAPVQQPCSDSAVPAKPDGISLREPALCPATFQTQAVIKPISLRSLQSYGSAFDTHKAVASDGGNPCIALYDYGDGIFAVKPDNSDGQPIAIDSVCAGLIECLQRVNKLAEDKPAHGTAAKVLLLTGMNQLFAAEGDPAAKRSVSHAASAIAGCVVPVIAVLTGENSYNAMLMAAAGEVMICSSAGTYSFHSTAVSEQEYRLFAERFGKACAGSLVSGSGPLSGATLRQAGLTMPVVGQAEIDDYALETARSIAQISGMTLAELKKHLSLRTRQLTEKLAAPFRPVAGVPGQADTNRLDAGFVWSPGRATAAAETPEPVKFDSDVVKLQKYRNGVVVVNLCDRSSKNTFSPEFVSGVIAAFEHINNTPGYKAVVLTGYDNYFACGGTKQGLLDIQNGSARFTDEQSYSMPLACEIPVIAAMQGHAIGAGWAMGLFCDWAAYSEESVYQSPYMLYGFTPGAGSTLIFPERLGHDLSREILLTAREFQGRELKRRGIAMPVMPRSEVFDYALALANHLALSTRDQLVQQKNRRSESIRQRLPDFFAQELAMHDKTFVGNQDVIDNINRHFNEAATQDQPAQPSNSSARAFSHQSPQQVLESLRQSLAEELQMQREQVDDETAFIDMGLDSITAVTWIRKINKQFGLSIGATKVYSYPTLTRFTEFVLSQMEYPQPAPCVDIGTVQENGDQLLAWLRETLARELLMSPDTLDDDMKFIDMGLDSITAVTWIRAINKRYGLSIGATKVYSYPTLAEFYQYLLKSGSEQGKFQNQEQPQQAVAAETTAQPCKQASEPVLVCSFGLAGSVDRQPVEPETVTVPPVRAESVAQSEPQQNPNQNSATQSIAIIGMAGQFPKADNVTQFWQNLMQGRECISDIPTRRWSVDEYYDPDRNAPGKTVCKRMGLLDDVDVFDPLFFNISPSEAEYMDPQQRLFLQTSWSCIEDAGYNPSDLSGSLCGVFVGCTASDYSQLMAGQAQCAQALMGESVSILPARIAYFLNLQGPCLSIDTACSSSLVALASACDSLVLGHSDLALAGGVYVINGPEIHVKMSKAGMLSPDGRCYSFDQRANGFVPGEGVGVLLLKRLEQAEQDGDDIYGVIRGWGVNQDGKSNGITAPNQESQTRLETGIYKKFGINPERIQLIEAHGTATKLGDPIEVDALRESFRRFTDRKHFCALGSVKSNIGHLATAAGVSGVIKSVLALQHRQLPPTINYQELNEHINLEGSPFYVNTECKPWDAPTGQKRHVAVSSFGFSGTNAHIVLEESSQQAAAAVAADAPVLLVLSAKSGQQLAVYAQAVSDYLADQYNSREISLSDMAYTFQAGRVALNHRLAVVANTPDELRTKLSNYASTGSDQDCVAGEVGKKAAAVDGSIQGEATTQQLRQLAERWVVGGAVDWSALYRPGQARRRHGLPTYPFAREHYWIPEAEAVEDDTVDSKPRRGSETPVIDSELWRGRELPDTIDWKNSLQHYQGKRVVVIYADDGERRAFNNLLMQLKQASGLDDSSNVSYYAVTEINAVLTAKRPDCMLFLGGVGTPPTDTSAIEQCLEVLSDQGSDSPVDVVFFMQADPVAADRLSDLISKAVKPEQSRCVLVTQDDCGDLNATMQRLFREWLAFGAQTEPFAALSQIHYAAGQRLARNGSAEQVAEHVCLINKEWRGKQPQPVTHPAERGAVLVLVNHESLQIARKLLEPEDFKKVILIGDNSVLPSQIQNSINYKDAESVRISAHILIDQYDNITHIIDLSDLYDTAKDSDADNPGKTVFYQTLIGTYNDIAILYFTKGLQHFQCKQMSLAGAKFAGLVKMLSADYPHVSARFIDIDQTAYDQPGQLRQIIMQEFDAELQETELCYRNGQRFAPVLSAVEAGAGEALPIAQDGVYVISGGTNGVGLEIAKYLAAKGCNKLVLMGITQLPPRESWPKAVNNGGLSPYLKNKLLELIELDKAVEHLQIYTGSLTSQHALKRYFKKIRAKLGPIRGVIHSAGVYSDSDTPGFVSKNLERMKQVWEPKVNGLENLHALFKADAPDFFVSLSSMTGLMPHLARGAGDYAMANSFVDFFSAYQHHQNNHTYYKTIIWSDWNQCGAITRIDGERVAAIEENFHRLGIRTFSNQEGWALFEQAMACTADSRVFIGYIDRQQFEQVRPQLLYAKLNAVEAGKQAVAAKPEAPVETVPENSILHHLDQWEAEKRSGLEVPVYRITDVISLDQIKHLEPNLIHRIHKLLFAGVAQPAAQEQPVDMAQVITNTVLEVLKLKSFDSTQPFQNYGLDSISAMVLATRLEKRLKQPVQPQWLIDFSTVETLSRHLTAQNSKSLLQ